MELKPVILFRYHRDHDEEYQTLQESKFTVRDSRSLCKNNLVIGRYSVLPYYEELENDLLYNGCNLINTHYQHNYIALFDYYYDVCEYTFRTWFDLAKAPDDIAFVVKGKTNSRKHRWNKECFAENKRRAAEIAHELKNDQLIGPQGVIYREYVPLKNLGEGLHGLPFSEEYRLFFLGERFIAGGYYWSQLEGEIPALPNEIIDYGKEIAKIISRETTFFVLDIARKATGDLVLVEVNDGQMSGLSTIDEKYFYDRLYEEVMNYDFNEG